MEDELGATLSGINNSTTGGYDVYCGVDVGKSDHHACALDSNVKKIHDKAPPNEQDDVVQVLTRLQAHGIVLVIVDQPASIEALVIVHVVSVSFVPAFQGAARREPPLQLLLAPVRP